MNREVSMQNYTRRGLLAHTAKSVLLGGALWR